MCAGFFVWNAACQTMPGHGARRRRRRSIRRNNKMGWFEEAFGDFGNMSLLALIIVIAVVAVAIICAVLYRRRKKMGQQNTKSAWTVRELSVAAICIALAFLLSFIKIFKLPQGGMITPGSMLPIMIFAYIYGWRKGLLVGLIYSLLQFAQDPFFLTPVQFLLDYIFGFSLLALAGLAKKNIIPGIALGGAIRFLCSFISGIVFFGMYAPPGVPVWLYSLGYNGTYIGIETGICIAICLIPAMRKTIERIRKNYGIGVKEKQTAAHAQSGLSQQAAE